MVQNLVTFVAKGEKIKSTKASFRVVLLKAKTDTGNTQDCFKTSKSTLKLVTNMLREKVEETIDKMPLSNHIVWFLIILTNKLWKNR